MTRLADFELVRWVPRQGALADLQMAESMDSATKREDAALDPSRVDVATGLHALGSRGGRPFIGQMVRMLSQDGHRQHAMPGDSVVASRQPSGSVSAGAAALLDSSESAVEAGSSVLSSEPVPERQTSSGGGAFLAIRSDLPACRLIGFIDMDASTNEMAGWRELFRSLCDWAARWAAQSDHAVSLQEFHWPPLSTLPESFFQRDDLLLAWQRWLSDGAGDQPTLILGEGALRAQVQAATGSGEDRVTWLPSLLSLQAKPELKRFVLIAMLKLLERS